MERWKGGKEVLFMVIVKYKHHNVFLSGAALLWKYQSSRVFQVK